MISCLSIEAAMIFNSSGPLRSSMSHQAPFSQQLDLHTFPGWLFLQGTFNQPEESLTPLACTPLTRLKIKSLIFPVTLIFPWKNCKVQNQVYSLIAIKGAAFIWMYAYVYRDNSYKREAFIDMIFLWMKGIVLCKQVPETTRQKGLKWKFIIKL